MGKSTISMAIFNCYVKLPEVTCALVVSNSPESGWFQFWRLLKMFPATMIPNDQPLKKPLKPTERSAKNSSEIIKNPLKYLPRWFSLEKMSALPEFWNNLELRQRPNEVLALEGLLCIYCVYVCVYVYIYNMFFPGQKVIGIVYSCTISTAAQDWFGCVWPQTTDPNVTLSHPHRPKMDVAGSAFSFEFRENFFGSC